MLVDAEKVFMHYKKGILNTTKCGSKLNHAVTAIGYGTSSYGLDYVIIRNSWGPRWGDKGHIKVHIKNGTDGTCGALLKNLKATTN